MANTENNLMEGSQTLSATTEDNEIKGKLGLLTIDSISSVCRDVANFVSPSVRIS